MKKIISLLLVAMMCVSLCACGNQTSFGDSNDSNGTSTEQQNQSDVSEELENSESNILTHDDVGVMNAEKIDGGYRYYLRFYSLVSNDPHYYYVTNSDVQEYEVGTMVKVTFKVSLEGENYMVEEIISIEKTEK